MKKIPSKIKVAPKTNSGAGTSWNMIMPKTVAPTGSRKAIVAVSKDFRFDKEEKYSVWAAAVGSKPKPTSGRIISASFGNAKILFAAGMLKTPTMTAVNIYIGNIVGSMVIWFLVFLP